jgi:dihydrofolate reductase
MGSVIVSSFISLDGYTEAPGRQMVPPPPTPDLFRRFIEPNMSRNGIFVYGRVTYEGMVGYWTSDAADKAAAARLADMRKVVYSRTLATADWGRVTISRGDDLAADVAAMKRETDKDITILGSAEVVNAYLAAGLVEEFHLLVTPITLGGGTPLFQGGLPRADLELIAARPLDSGAVLLDYRVRKG